MRPGRLNAGSIRDERAVGREDVYHALVHVDTVERAQEHGLIVGLFHGVPVAERDVHVVEEDDAAAVDREEILHRLNRVARLPRGLVGVRAHFLVFEAQPEALVQEPAAGARLPVAGRSGQEQPALGPTAQFADSLQVLPVEVADGVLPEDFELVRVHHGRGSARGALAAGPHCEAEQFHVIESRDDVEVVSLRLEVFVDTRHAAGEADVSCRVQSNAELRAGVVVSAAGHPVAEENAVERDERPAGCGLEEVEGVTAGCERDRVADLCGRSRGFDELTVIRGIGRERCHACTGKCPGLGVFVPQRHEDRGIGSRPCAYPSLSVASVGVAAIAVKEIAWE